VEQLRAVGYSLYRPALAAAAFAALATLLIGSERAGSGKAIPFHPEYRVLPGLLGLLLPIAVWMGEERFGAGFLWTLPVDRRRHALAKVVAGWVWLMAAVALVVLWVLALAVMSGGNVLADETRRVLPSFSFGAAPFDPAAVLDVRSKAQPLFWLAPFTAATGTYLIASALALGFRQPLRWVVGAVSGFFLLIGLADAAGADRVITSTSVLLDWLIKGPYGIDTLLTARTETLQVAATLSTGESLVVWRALPDVNEWATATVLWTGAAAALLWAAISRHREGRA
jgi:hypothetical protein